MDIIYRDSEHRSIELDCQYEILHSSGYLDEYHRAAAYLLSLDEVLRKHISEVYSFNRDEIIPEALQASWQTGTSRKTTRLLFNLWNGYCSEGEPIEEEQISANYTPENIFCCEYAPYYWQAIKLRFPEYTETE